jgi:hypothetical protein
MSVNSLFRLACVVVAFSAIPAFGQDASDKFVDLMVPLVSAGKASVAQLSPDGSILMGNSIDALGQVEQMDLSKCVSTTDPNVWMCPVTTPKCDPKVNKNCPVPQTGGGVGGGGPCQFAMCGPTVSFGGVFDPYSGKSLMQTLDSVSNLPTITAQ